jgi:hypothetical protein
MAFPHGVEMAIINVFYPATNAALHPTGGAIRQTLKM